MVGSPATTSIEDLLLLRPLVRRSKKRDLHDHAARPLPHASKMYPPSKRPSIDGEMEHAAQCLLALDRAMVQSEAPGARRQWI